MAEVELFPRKDPPCLYGDGKCVFHRQWSPVLFYEDTWDNLPLKDHPLAQFHLTSLPGVNGGDKPCELLLGNPCSQQPALSHVPSPQVTAEGPQGHCGRRARTRQPHLWRSLPNSCLGLSSLGKNSSTFCMVENSVGSSHETFASYMLCSPSPLMMRTGSRARCGYH